MASGIEAHHADARLLHQGKVQRITGGIATAAGPEHERGAVLGRTVNLVLIQFGEREHGLARVREVTKNAKGPAE